MIKENEVVGGADIFALIQQAQQCLSDHNRKSKVTVKKNYINDILQYAKGAINVA